MEKVKVEVRAAEGGEDSKLLVKEMVQIYKKAIVKRGFTLESEYWLDGKAWLTVTGKECKSFFKGEAGGHQWQRVPPTEKRGRVHTSLVTVAVLDEERKSNFKLDRSLVDRQYTRGSGNGGQNRNKVETCVVLTYKPTGLQIRVEEHRTRQQNEEVAWRRMEERLAESLHTKEKSEYDSVRTGQIGLGMRGSKIRTYRVQDNVVLDHLTEKKARLDDLYKGLLEKLR